MLLLEVSKLNDSVRSNNHIGETLLSSEKERNRHRQMDTDKETIYSFNDIQASGLHYYNIYKTVTTMMIII